MLGISLIVKGEFADVLFMPSVIPVAYVCKQVMLSELHEECVESLCSQLQSLVVGMYMDQRNFVSMPVPLAAALALCLKRGARACGFQLASEARYAASRIVADIRCWAAINDSKEQMVVARILDEVDRN